MIIDSMSIEEMQKEVKKLIHYIQKYIICLQKIDVFSLNQRNFQYIKYLVGSLA